MPFSNRRTKLTAAALAGAFVILSLSFVSAQGQTGQPNESALPSAQQTPPPPPRPRPTPDPQARRQAYLKYIEAHALLGSRPPKAAEAAAAYREVIRLDPTAADPHADLAELYLFYLSKFDESEREAMEAIRLDNDCLNGHKVLARLYVFAVRIEKDARPVLADRAIREYEQVTRLDPGNAEAWAFLADLYQTKKDQARQIKALEQWAAAPVYSDIYNFYGRLTNGELSGDRAYYQLSQLYLAQGKNAQALEAARRAYEMEPESPDYSSNLIRALRYSPTLEEELRVYVQLSKVADSPGLQVGYGAAQVRAGQYAQAVERLRNCVKRDPTNSSAIGLLSVAQRRAGKRVEAVETLKLGIARADSATRTKLKLELAETYDELGRVDEAIAQYELIFDGFLGEDKPDPQGAQLFGDVMNRLVRLYSRVGNKAKLQSVYTRAQKLLGENNPLLDSLNIEILREDGKRREALDLTRAAARRYPEERTFKFTEALLLGESGNFREGAELLRGMISDHPEFAAEDASVYLILSNIQLQNGQVMDAETSVRKALQLSPDDDELLLQLSSVQDKAGRHGDSEKTLRELLRRDPENATALNNLGYFLLERGERYEEAVRLIERAINIEPTNGNFLDSLGYANYKLGRLEQARVHLEKARMYSRRSATVYEHLGDVLKDQGRVQEARRHWEKALQLSVEAQETARLKDKLKIAMNQANR
ncbi:MAG TPA: tetratricopeptide repeat protein [Blastocatellia bacterium]|nr:tetratricopeptide repeat protein [Blastocatellia bacterium]